MENKCPVCGSPMTLYEEHMDGSDTIACNECPFTCAEKDLLCIAAAMDLARARVGIHNIPTNIKDAPGGPGEKFFDATIRVLEVFGDK